MSRFRPLTWIVLAWNALMLAWLIAGLAGSADTCADEFGSAREACESGAAIGTGIGIAFILFVAAMGDVVLGVIWLVTRKPRRACPVCGVQVPVGRITCSSCGHDFRQEGERMVTSSAPGACENCGAPPVRPPSPICSRCGSRMPASAS